MKTIINPNLRATEIILTVNIAGFGQVKIADPNDKTGHAELDQYIKEFYSGYMGSPQDDHPQFQIANKLIDIYGGEITLIEKGDDYGIVY